MSGVCCGVCTDLVDIYNCGACGHVCGDGQNCCKEQFGPECSDPATDGINCGSCGNVCYLECVGGTCSENEAGAMGTGDASESGLDAAEDTADLLRCEALGIPCLDPTDCCSGSCDFTPAKCCAPIQAACTAAGSNNGYCCQYVGDQGFDVTVGCISGTCCVQRYGDCRTANDCCNGYPCTPSPNGRSSYGACCQPWQGPCTANADCCWDTCTANVCCLPSNASTSNGVESCCSKAFSSPSVCQ